MNTKRKFQPYRFRHIKTGKIYQTRDLYEYEEIDEYDEVRLMKAEDGSWKECISYNPTIKFTREDTGESFLRTDYETTFIREKEDFLKKFEPLTEEEHINNDKARRARY